MVRMARQVCNFAPVLFGSAPAAFTSLLLKQPSLAPGRSSVQVVSVGQANESLVQRMGRTMTMQVPFHNVEYYTVNLICVTCPGWWDFTPQISVLLQTEVFAISSEVAFLSFLRFCKLLCFSQASWGTHSTGQSPAPLSRFFGGAPAGAARRASRIHCWCCQGSTHLRACPLTGAHAKTDRGWVTGGDRVPAHLVEIERRGLHGDLACV